MLLYSSSLQKLPDALVAQLDRVSDYESEGQGFESLRARQRKSHETAVFDCSCGFSFCLKLEFVSNVLVTGFF